MKEQKRNNEVAADYAPVVLSQGRWDENITWEFLISDERPDPSLCTAVCCVATFQHKLLIVLNKRGWELPAGKMEQGESAEDAIIREVREETGTHIEQPIFFGFKKLTSREPVTRSDSPSLQYPFPHSYVVYFRAHARECTRIPLLEDVREVKLATYGEAKGLLAPGGQYGNILEYLMEKVVISM